MHSRVLPSRILGPTIILRKPTKAEIQPILDHLSKKVAGWKPKLLSLDGRLRLIKSVLMAVPVHFLSVMELPKWAIKEINRKCRGFLWKGQEEVSGGHCLVAWKGVSATMECGGLGIKDLELFGQALRLKWLLKRIEHKGRPWTSVNMRMSEQLQIMMNSVGHPSSWVTVRTPTYGRQIGFQGEALKQPTLCWQHT